MSRRSSLELTAVVLTATLHFLFYDLLPGRGAFILLAVVGWVTYVVLRVRRHSDALVDLGLSRVGLAPSVRAAGAILIVGSAVCAIVAIWRGALRLESNMLWTALLYPVWGIVQQTLVQGMVVRNLAPSLPRPVIVVVAGVLFGAVHLPHIALAAATAVLGCAFTIVFLRHKNVWPLGICHGWLGVLFYYWALGRDPWQEIVSQL